MEDRIKKHREASPERAKVRAEKSLEYRYDRHRHRQRPRSRKVPVVYYLCRNRQLEHPHFVEVHLSSSADLFLRDVIQRLNVLRGRGIASMYSWSCKRSYKNGYVWHDLCEDDVIHPAHGDEYILKGSELFERPNAGRLNHNRTSTIRGLPRPPSSRNKEESPSSSSSDDRDTKSVQDYGSLSPIEHKSNGVADASTQTEEDATAAIESRQICTRVVSTDDGLSEPHQSQKCQVEQNPEIRTDTLESLIIADIRKFKSFKVLEEEGFGIPSSTKIKVANVIMQLVSCGSISVKDRSLGLIPTYPSSKFCSPLMLGEVDRTADNPRLMATTSKDEDRRSSSHNADSCKNDKGNVMKIEERIASGARVVIQSKESTGSEGNW